MQSKNSPPKLLDAIQKRRMTQAELVKVAGLSSEARLSRIINYQVEPTLDEMLGIVDVLKEEHKNLGFKIIKSFKNGGTLYDQIK